VRAAALVPAVLLLTPTLTLAAGPEVHGEGQVFRAPGLVVAWGVVRAGIEADTDVVIRLAFADVRYAYVRVDAVDPFTGRRQPVEPGAQTRATVDIRSRRATFADFPRREIRLYLTADAWRADDPALTIYYLGVPDAAPEFTSAAALEAYLADAVARARRLGP
jgi:hypothetical protein